MKNFNYSFNIILRLLETDNTERETDRYRNIYHDDKEIMSPRKRTGH